MGHRYWKAYQLAYRQGGVLSRDQLLTVGISRSSIDRHARELQWKRIHRAIYQLIEMLDPASRLRAAVVVLPTAVVSHESAAELHGVEFDLLDRGLVTVSVISETTHNHVGTIVHRNSDILPHHLEEIDGLEVTTELRTLFDLAQQLGRKAAFDLLDQQRMLNRITMSQIDTMIEDLGRQGKPGTTIFREYAEDRRWNNEVSPLHRMATELISASGLPPPEEEFHIPWDSGRRFDLAYQSAKLAIELDGIRYHSTPDQFQADRSRDRDAHKNGWFILRFTWHDLTHRPDEFIEHIKSHLADTPIA